MGRKTNGRALIVAVFVSIMMHGAGITVVEKRLARRNALPTKPYLELVQLDDDKEKTEKETVFKDRVREMVFPTFLVPPIRQTIFRPAPKKPDQAKKERDQKKKEEDRKKKDRAKDQSLQIVDLGPPREDDQAPDQARFASERNSRVDKETVKPSEARTGSPGQKGKIEGTNPKPTTKDHNQGQPQALAKAPPPPPKYKAPPVKKTPQQKAPEPGTKSTSYGEGRDGVSPDPAKPKRKRSSANGPQKPAPGRAEDDVKTEVAIAKPAAPPTEGGELAMGMHDAAKTYESDDGSVDHTPADVAKGSITALNSKAYAFAAFFNQMKKVIRFYWEPQRALESINWNGSTLVTEVMIVAAANGDIVSVNVTKSSGYSRVDQEAVQAVRKAAPFYNIPAELLDDNGRFVCPFGFVIERR